MTTLVAWIKAVATPVRAVWGVIIVLAAYVLITLLGRQGRGVREALNRTSETLTRDLGKTAKARAVEAEADRQAAEALLHGLSRMTDPTIQDAIREAEDRRREALKKYPPPGAVLLALAVTAFTSAACPEALAGANEGAPVSEAVRGLRCAPDEDAGGLLAALRGLRSEVATDAADVIESYQVERKARCALIEGAIEAVEALEESARRRRNLLTLQAEDSEAFRRAYEDARAVALNESRRRFDCVAGGAAGITTDEKAAVMVGIGCGLLLGIGR